MSSLIQHKCSIQKRKRDCLNSLRGKMFNLKETFSDDVDLHLVYRTLVWLSPSVNVFIPNSECQILEV